MTESAYKFIIDQYLQGNLNVDQFIEEFMEKWKHDRDINTIYDQRFQRLIDRLFTSCDCYSPDPERKYELSEQQLKNEISLLRHIWFG